jgi:hypothetical protein
MTTKLLESLIEPFAECLTIESARKIAALRADDSLQSRMDELADKANRGTLSDAEQTDYDRLLAAYHFVSVVQARARRMIDV